MKENVRKVIEAAEWELGGFENEMQDGYEDATFFNQPIDDQVNDIYRIIAAHHEKEIRFLGKENVKYLIKGIVMKSEYNEGKEA